MQSMETQDSNFEHELSGKEAEPSTSHKSGLSKAGVIQISITISIFILSMVIVMADFSEKVNFIVHIVSLAIFLFWSVWKIIQENFENETANDSEEKVNNGLILFSSIKRKNLSHNPNIFRQILELTALLRHENFRMIQNRLSKNNMRKGFCCLFYGSPGTGKTETSYQIALETCRNILPIDISSIQSMHPGESQQNIKSVFEKYRSLLKNSANTPILLLNEADAIISKRTIITNKNPAIERDDNAMQNVLLQELENFEGILIATTNLTENFDKAFDRRFLYKIKFSMPDINTRTDIWQTIIPELKEQEAHELAVQYTFSGGQIENIARKRIVENILSGDNPSIEKIKYYCQDETVSSDNELKIGFIS
jgi:hypothetical protein